MDLKDRIFQFLIDLGFEPDYIGEYNKIDNSSNFHMNIKEHPIDVQGTFDETLGNEYANYYLNIRLIGEKHIEEEREVQYTRCEEGADEEFKTFEEISEEIKKQIKYFIQ